MTATPQDPQDPQDVVKVYSGPLVNVESYRAACIEEGIVCNVVGTELSASFGSALPDSIELWVHRGDLQRAEAVIHRGKKSKEKPIHDRPHQHFPHPTDDAKPGPAPYRKEPYVNPNPGA